MKIAVVGATGRVGRHVVDVLEGRGHGVVAVSRGHGVDVITGTGLDAGLAGVDCVVDVATGPSADRNEATRFFTTAAANLQRASTQAGVRRIVVVSIIGIDRFQDGYNAAKSAHEQAMLAGAAARCASCGRRSSASSSASWWTGEPRVRSRTSRGCARNWSPPGAWPRHWPTWPPAPRRPCPRRSWRSRGHGRRTSSRWRRCSRRSAAGPGRSRACATRTTRTPCSWRPGPSFPGSDAVLAGPTFEEWLDTTR